MPVVRLNGKLDPGTPEWWLRRMLRRLDVQRREAAEYAAFHAGTQPLAFASDKFQDVFGHRFKRLPANFMPRVVDAERERLHVMGFRYGDDTAADKTVWRIWQANSMDAESAIAHETALVSGIAFAMVAPGDDGEDPLITIEGPDEVVVAHEPGNRRKRAAALKSWVGDDGIVQARLTTPELVWSWHSEKPYTDEHGEPSVGSWRVLDVAWVQDEEFATPHGFEDVPVVPLVNRPRRNGTGRSEIEPVMGNQLAINKLRFDALVASEAAAFPQRWAVNLDIPVDPDTGKPISPFRPGVDQLWTVRRPTAEEAAEFGDRMPEPKLGQFEQADLAPYISLIREEVVEMASITGTPYYQLVGPPTSVAPSGEAIKSSESALVRKSEAEAVHLGESWEEVMRLAQVAMGDAGRTDGETMWAEMETRNEAARTDAVAKQVESGLIPPDFALEQLGYSQQEIARIKAMRDDVVVVPAQAPAQNGMAELGPLLAGR